MCCKGSWTLYLSYHRIRDHSYIHQLVWIQLIALVFIFSCNILYFAPLLPKKGTIHACMETFLLNRKCPLLFYLLDNKEQIGPCFLILANEISFIEFHSLLSPKHLQLYFSYNTRPIWLKVGEMSQINVQITLQIYIP